MKVKVLLWRRWDDSVVLGVFTDDKKLESCKDAHREDFYKCILNEDGELDYDIQEFEVNDTGWEEE